MPHDFLNDILDYKRSLLHQKKVFLASLKTKAKDEKLTRYRIFKNAISKAGPINLIAEIKKASPSQGIIREDFSAVRIAQTYQTCGAAAISVLTEDKYFLGKIAYLKQVSDHVELPVLMKDFIIDEVQIYEAFYQGASAVLLIAAILDNERLKNLFRIASDLDLDCLIEVHDKTELERALKVGAEIIGVNNRDLHTFKVDLKVSRDLIPLIPGDRIIVAESGIKSHEEVELLQELGAHAVLIGETFLKALQMDKKIKEVMHGK